MTRPCRHCGRNHFDFDCLQAHSESYFEQIASSSASSETAKETSEYSGSGTDGDQPEQQENAARSFHTNTNGQRRVRSTDPIPLEGNYTIVEILKADIMGKGISYLSAEPCPIRATLGKPPSEENPCISGAADSGGASIIRRDSIPDGYQTFESPMAPSFSGIGKSSMKALGFVTLSVYLPNTATLSGDKRNAQVLLLWVEFQIVENCKTAFLIGRDAIKAYKFTIDEPLKSIIIRPTNAQEKRKKDNKTIFKIPISDNDRFGKRCHDAQVLLVKDVNIKPREEVWLPIRFKRFNDNSSLLFTPNHITNNEEQTHGSSCYSLFSDSTNRLLFLNTSDKPIKLPKGKLLGTVKPIQPNTLMSYFNDDTSVSNEQESERNRPQINQMMQQDQRLEPSETPRESRIIVGTNRRTTNQFLWIIR